MRPPANLPSIRRSGGRWILSAALAFAPLAAADPADLAELVYVEDSPAATEMLLRAEEVRAQGRLGDAATLLDRLIEEHGGGLVPAASEDDARRYVEARALVERRLLGDPELLAAYRDRFGAEAARQLQEIAADQAPAARAAALASLARRFGATEAGREAALDAAALALEAGDPEAAAAWLAAAGGDSPRSVDLASAADRVREALASVGTSERSSPATGDPTAPILAAAAWTHWFGEGVGPGEELSKGFGGRQNVVRGRGGFAASRGPVPEVRGEAVFVNTGDTLLRLDRDAGRVVWAAEAPGAADADGFSGGGTAEGRGVLVAGDRAVAVLGSASEARRRGFGNPQGGDGGTSLVCVRTVDGEPLWSVTPADLDPSLERADFVGTPLGGEAASSAASLVVLLRRTGRAGLEDFQAAGVDAATGELRWLRPLSSVTTDRRFGGREAFDGGAVAAGGRVFLGEGFGVVAGFAAATGEVGWLRVDSGVESGVGFDLPGGEPILTGAGLLLPGQMPLLLDPATGERLPLPASLADPDDAARSVTAVRDGGRLVGLVATRSDRAEGLDPDTLAVRWSTPWSQPVAPPGAGNAGAIEAIAPAGAEVFRHRWSDGVLLERRAWPGGAAFVPLGGGGWLVGNGGAVSLFDRPGAPLVRLAARVKQNPNDPSAALALAYRGVDTGEPAAFVAGAEAALSAGGGVAELLDLVANADSLPPPPRRRVLDALLPAAGVDRVKLAFVSAALAEEEGNPAAVVAGLQAVIDDPALADRLFALGGVTRRAGLEARERLAVALAAGRERGLDLYEAQRRRAAGALAAAEASGDFGALLEVARRFPFAASASRALTAAAATADAGTARDARSLRRWAYRAALDAVEAGGDPAAPAAAASAAAALVSAEANAGRADAALGWVRRFERDVPGVPLPLDAADTDPAAAEAWVRRVAAAAGGTAISEASTLPRLDSPRVAGDRRPGRLAPAVPAADGLDGGRTLGGAFLAADPAAAPAGAAGGSRVVIADAGGAAGEPVWEALAPAGAAHVSFRFPAPPADAVVLLDDGDLLLLFSPGDGTLHRVRPPAGSSLGTIETFDPAPLLAAVPDAFAKPPADEGAAPADPLGGVARRLAAEREREAQQMEQIRRMREQRAARQGNGGRVVIRLGVDGGFGGPGNLRGMPPDAGLFAVATPATAVVADATGRLVATDPATGRVQWARRAPVDQLTGLALTPEHLVVRGVDAPGTDSAVFRLARLDPLTGALLAPEVVEASQEPRGVAFGGGRMVVAFDRFVAAYGLPDGGLLWRSPAPEDERNGFSGDLLLGDGVVVAGTAAAPGVGAGTLPIYDAASGALRARPLAPASGPAALTLADGRLHAADGRALGTDGRLLFAPAGPADSSGVPSPGAAAVTASEVLLPGSPADGSPGTEVVRLDRATGRRLGALRLPPMPGGLSAGPVLLRVVDGLGVAQDAGGLLLLTPAKAGTPPA